MAAVRFIEVQARPIEFLDLTSLTLDEFDQLIEPFEEAFQALWHREHSTILTHPVAVADDA